MVTHRRSAALGLALALCLSPALAAAEAEQPIVLPPGAIRVTAAAGPQSIDREWTWGMALSLGAGLVEGLELALPLALSARLIGDDDGSGIALAAGVTDLWVTKERVVLLSPAIVLAGRARVSVEASLRAAFDLTGVERWSLAGTPPGAAAPWRS
jgi:hypothetical protein